MQIAIYILGSLVCLMTGILLLRGFLRGRQRLLLWSGLCFLGLAVSNCLVFVDRIVFPNIDLYPLRLISAAIAMMVMLMGLIWEDE